MKQRITALLLAVLLTVSLLPAVELSADAASSGTCGSKLTWTLSSSGTLTVSGTGAMDDFTVNATPWFVDSMSIKSVVIKNGVTSVGDYAFCNCNAVSSISLPNSLTSIGHQSFYQCLGVTSLTLPDSLTYIGRYAFDSCKNLTRVTLPSGNCSIDDGAFCYCSSLETVYAGTLDEWCSLSFGNVNSTPMLYAETLYLDGSKFSGRLTLPEDLTAVGDAAFTGWNTMTEVVFPAGFTTVGDYSFYDCSALMSLTVPDSMERFGSYAFNSCESLADIYYAGSASDWASVVAPPSVDRVHYACTGSAGHWTKTTVSATCTEDGYTAESCSCGYERSKTTLPATGHSYTSVVTPPTCTGQGYTTHTCSDCGNTYDDDFTPATGHSYSYTVSNKATTSAVGTLIGTCSVCGGTDSVTLPKLSTADYDYAVIASPSCTAAGTAEYTWKNTDYGTFAFRVELPKTGHSYTAVVTPPTCTGQGYTTYTCSDCGDSYVGDYTPAGPHGYTYVIETTPTVNSAGTLTGICSGCGGTDSVTLPKLSTAVYDYTVIASPSCTAAGSAVYTWKNTDYGSFSFSVELPKTGHSYTAVVTPPTCTGQGYTTYTCSDCGDSHVGDYTPAIGHSYENGVCTSCGEADPEYVTPGVTTVTRVYGLDRYATAFHAADALKAELGVSQFPNIVVASGTNFPDALSGSYLAAMKDAPILLVKGPNVEEVKAYIRENLTPGGTVYLLGGTGVVPTSMESGLDGFTVKRLGGATRYDTNLLILQEAGVAGKDILVCTGLGFADSLSASAVGLPILLVNNTLLPAQIELLSSGSGNIIIVGGWGAVSDSIAQQLSSYGSVERLSGSTRYETSVLVAQRFFASPTGAVLTYAENFPDGLSGGTIAYSMNAPLILTSTGRESAAAAYTASLGIRGGYVLGGPALISDYTVSRIFS